MVNALRRIAAAAEVIGVRALLIHCETATSTFGWPSSRPVPPTATTSAKALRRAGNRYRLDGWQR